MSFRYFYHLLGEALLIERAQKQIESHYQFRQPTKDIECQELYHTEQNLPLNEEGRDSKRPGHEN